MIQRSQRWFPVVLLCVGVAAAGSGCSKRRKTETAPPAAPAVDVSSLTSAPSGTSDTEGAPKDPEFPNPGLQKPGTINEDGVEVGAAALTDALQNYYYATAGQVPESLEAMVRLKLIARIPVPPPGKKYVLDRKKAVVTMVNAR